MATQHELEQAYGVILDHLRDNSSDEVEVQNFQGSEARVAKALKEMCWTSKAIRDRLMAEATSQGKPVLRMISQRERIPYHPEGNPDILIEMALEPIHVGETFTGHRWQLPKIDLEIKIGPDKDGLRHSLLAFEQKRLCKIFPLKQQLVSSPTEGFEAIAEAMETDAGRAAFDKLKTREKWWEEGTSPVVPRLRA